jgi:ABC-type maltose transport system permease subunit
MSHLVRICFLNIATRFTRWSKLFLKHPVVALLETFVSTAVKYLLAKVYKTLLAALFNLLYSLFLPEICIFCLHNFVTFFYKIENNPNLVEWLNNTLCVNELTLITAVLNRWINCIHSCHRMCDPASVYVRLY